MEMMCCLIFKKDKDIKMNFKYYCFDYLEYEKKSKEIYDYFESVCVMEKLLDEKNIWINIIEKKPFLYDIVFLNDKNYFIFRNYSIIENKYNPYFSCMFLLKNSWAERMSILGTNYMLGGLNREVKNEYELFYKNKFICDFLKFKKIDVSSSIYVMSDDVRIEYHIDDVDLNKILFLKGLLETKKI